MAACAHLKDAAVASCRVLPHPLKAVMWSHWYAPSLLLLLLLLLLLFYVLILALLLALHASALL
jgi:hypothetical protein